jgi:hypothetical protein
MSVLSHTELSESEIDAARRELLKRLQLFRITSLLNQLPPATPDLSPACVTPGAVAGGASYMEKFA